MLVSILVLIEVNVFFYSNTVEGKRGSRNGNRREGLQYGQGNARWVPCVLFCLQNRCNEQNAPRSTYNKE